MAVKGDPGHQRRSQADRRAATRSALVRAGRELFSEKGFVGAGREEIVARAGVTRGAMYHHFASKEELFRAVFETVEAEVLDQVATAAMVTADPLQQLRLGSRAYLDIAVRADVRRICLVDAPAVLSPEYRRTFAEAHSLGLIRAALAAAMAQGQIAALPVDPLAHLVMAAVLEAATLVGEGADRDEVGAVLDVLLERLQ